MSDLSIIILTLNNKKILGDCIDSIYKHTKAISFEVLVVDNNSSDGTQAYIKSKYPSVILIENEKNLGFSGGNNKGLNIAKGKYALILNDDTYIQDDSFSRIVKYMDSDKTVGICGPRLLNIDGTVQRQGSIFNSRQWSSKTPIEVQLIIGACLFLRMSVVNKVELFDENLFFYNDDLDLCKRVKNAGFKVVYSPIADVYHYGGYSSKKPANRLLLVEGFRGGLYFCRKHYGLVVYTIYRLLLLFSLILMLPFVFLNRAKLNAYLEVISIIIKQQIVFKP